MSRRSNRFRRRRLTHQLLDQRHLLAGDVALVDDLVNLLQNASEVSLDVLANDVFSDDYDGARQISGVSTGSQGGQIRIADDGASLLYRAPADYRGSETFQYFVDGSESASVKVSIKSPLADFEQTIFRLQDEYQFDLLDLADFPDDYSGEEQITLVGLSSLGADLQISDDGRSILYRPAVGVSGRDSFTYIVDDHFVANTIIKVENVLEADEFEVLQNSGTTNLNLLANDFSGHGSEVDQLADDAVITHILSGRSGNHSADVQIAGDGRSVNFTPVTDLHPYFEFRYVVNGRFEQHASVYVQRPVRDDNLAADQNGGQHTFDVLANDYYYSWLGSGSKIDVVDFVTSVEQGDSGGTVELSADGSRVIYTPAADFTGTETFEYTADGKYTATVRVNVTSPVRDVRTSVFLATESAIDVLANDFQADQSTNAEITSLGDSTIGATIRLGDDGIVYYTPPDDANPAVRSDSFEYTVNDQYAATVHVYLASITVADYLSIDLPTEQTVYVLENDRFDQGYSGERRITSVSTPSDGGNVSISADGSYVVYLPGSNDETFTYTVDDRFTETVTAQQRHRLSSDRAVGDQNGGSIVIDVLRNDFDWALEQHYGRYPGDRDITAVTDPESGGSASIVDGKVVYTPAEDFVGQDRFTYIVDDYQEATVTVNVIRRADDDIIRVDPNSQNNELNVLVNDLLGADYEGAGMITAVEGSGGLIRVAQDGRSLLYSPDPGFEGEVQFVYTVDGKSKATVTIHVQDQLADALPTFESVEQMRDHLLRLSIDRYYGEYRFLGFFDAHVVNFAGDTTSDATSDYSVGSIPFGFSETNVQVSGVDEDDLVETDGNYIYSLRGSELAIVSSLTGGDMELMSQTAIEGQPTGMYFSGDRVTVISRIVNQERLYPTSDLDLAYARADFVLPRQIQDVTTVVTVFDVSDRADPTIIQQTSMDGDFTSSRRIGDQVFLVLNSGNLLFEPRYRTNEEGNSVRETKEQFIARVETDYAALLVDVLPSYESTAPNSDIIRAGRLVVPEDIYVSGDDAMSLSVIVSLNMAATEPGLTSTSGVMTNRGGEIYANANSLYVFTPDEDQQDGQRATRILKFNWDGQSGAIDFAATGKVAGAILNQFSADELDGILRITTSISNSGTGNFSGLTETAIFTLEDDKGLLEFVGSLKNVAPGQDVKSVRYFGDRAFVTTFRNVDPLYAVDLSDAADPRLMGHASIPGFSSYAQVISEDRLLTVGSDRGSAMISLFDISDFADPQLVDLYQLPRHATSEANLDHHAFGWFAQHEILALPTGQHFYERFDEDGDGYPEATRRVQQDELAMLHVGVNDAVGEEGLTLRGRIQHNAKVIRSVYVGDFVYSVGMDAVRAVQVGAEDTIVDEVIYPVDSPEVELHPVARSLPEIGAAARRLVADSMGVELGSVMVVTQEVTGGLIDTVLRVGTNHYRYHGENADGLSLVDDAFAFVDGWQNKDNQWDVNDDGEVTSLDALLAINALGRLTGGDLPSDRVMRQVHSATKYVDTSGDGKLTALDALLVINRLSTENAVSERISGSSDAVYVASVSSAETEDDDDRDSVTTIMVDRPIKV